MKKKVIVLKEKKLSLRERAILAHGALCAFVISEQRGHPRGREGEFALKIALFPNCEGAEFEAALNLFSFRIERALKELEQAKSGKA